MQASLGIRVALAAAAAMAASVFAYGSPSADSRPTASTQATSSTAPAATRPAEVSGSGQVGQAPNQYWSRRVSEAGRTAAVEAAGEDARKRLAKQLADVEITPEITLGQFVKLHEPNGADLRVFLPAARVRAVRYHEDAPIVEVRMATPRRAVYAALRSWALGRSPVRRELMGQLEKKILRSSDATIESIGIASAPVGEVKDITEAERHLIELARSAPNWIEQTLRGTGAVRGGADDDEIAAAAEQAARDDLLAKVRALRVDDNRTVGDLLEADKTLRKDFDEYFSTVRLSAQPPRNMKEGFSYVVLEIDLAPLWQLVCKSIGQAR